MIYNVVVGYTYRGENGNVYEHRLNSLFSAENDTEAVKGGVRHAHLYEKNLSNTKLAYVKVFDTKFGEINEEGYNASFPYHNQLFFWQIDKALKPAAKGLGFEPLDEFLERWLAADDKFGINCH